MMPFIIFVYASLTTYLSAKLLFEGIFQDAEFLYTPKGIKEELEDLNYFIVFFIYLACIFVFPWCYIWLLIKFIFTWYPKKKKGE